MIILQLRMIIPGRKAALWIGILSVFFTTITPVILANRDVRFEDTFDRYTLAGSLGVSLILISLLFKYFNASKRRWIAGGLIFISMITHYQNAVFFKNFWEYQKQLMVAVILACPRL